MRGPSTQISRKFRANIMGNASHKLCEYTTSSHTFTYTILLICALSPPCACYSAASRPPAPRSLMSHADASGVSSAAAEREVCQDRVVEGKRFVVAFLSGRLVGFVTDPTLYQRLVGFVTDPTKRATKRSSQFSSVTLASRMDPNFARISRNLPQPKFRKTLRETLTQGKSPAVLFPRRALSVLRVRARV